MVEINDDPCGLFNETSQIKSKNSMLKSSLFDFRGAYILVSRTITNDRAGDDDNAKQLYKRNKGLIFRKCAPVTDCISKMSNTQIDYAKDLDAVLPIDNLVAYINDYSKTSGRLWKYCRDDQNDNMVESGSFIFKMKITGKSSAAGDKKDVKIAAPLNHLGNFQRTLKIPLIHYEINLILTYSTDFVISFAAGETDTKSYLSIVTLSAQDNIKLTTIKIRFSKNN